jgi:hypothetical protein
MLDAMIFTTYWGTNWCSAIHTGLFAVSHIDQLTFADETDGLLDYNDFRSQFRYKGQEGFSEHLIRDISTAWRSGHWLTVEPELTVEPGLPVALGTSQGKLVLFAPGALANQRNGLNVVEYPYVIFPYLPPTMEITPKSFVINNATGVPFEQMVPNIVTEIGYPQYVDPQTVSFYSGLHMTHIFLYTTTA